MTYGGLPPFVEHSETSRAAAMAVLPRAGSIRWRVLELIRQCGAHGATSQEAQLALKLSHQTGSARVAELLQGGLIIESGRTRPTLGECQADVLVIAPEGTPPRNIRGRITFVDGFRNDEMPDLYRQLRGACEAARRQGHELGPLLVRLGFRLRAHADKGL